MLQTVYVPNTERREEVKKRHHDYEPKTGLDHNSAVRIYRQDL